MSRARSLYVLPVVMALLWGLLSRRRWAWLTTRAVAALAPVLNLTTFVAVWLFFPQLQTGVRMWITAVSIGLGSLAISTFLALGKRPARLYFETSRKFPVTFCAARATCLVL